MDFDFSDDQQQLRDAVAKWVEKSYDFERRKKVVAAGGFDRGVYQELAELGLTGICVDEDHGGLGMGPVEAMVVLEELGRGIVCEPLAQAFVTGTVIQAHGGDEVKRAWLPRIASGEALVVLAQQERQARYRLDVCEAKAVKAGAGYALKAQKHSSRRRPGRRLRGARHAGGQAGAVPGRARRARRAHARLPDAGRVARRRRQLDGAPAQLITADGLAALRHAADIGIAAPAPWAWARWTGRSS
jgi:hypothetical protein